MAKIDWVAEFGEEAGAPLVEALGLVIVSRSVEELVERAGEGELRDALVGHGYVGGVEGFATEGDKLSAFSLGGETVVAASEDLADGAGRMTVLVHGSEWRA